MKEKTLIATPAAPAAIGPYAQAVAVDGFIYTSGPAPHGIPPPVWFPDGIEAQTRQSLQNIRAILEKAGCGMDRVVKTTVFLSDMNDFAAMNAVYATFFQEGNCPAPFCGGDCPASQGRLVEIEAVAHL